MRVWTVIGLWDGDTPVPCGVVEGEHEVHGAAEHATTFFAGPWATSVEADDPDTAERLAAAEMEAS